MIIIAFNLWTGIVSRMFARARMIFEHFGN